MKSASLESSDRLKRVDSLLQTGAEFTTMQIIQQANVCAVNSIIAELRDNGRTIICRREKDRWFYRMEVQPCAAN